MPDRVRIVRWPSGTAPVTVRRRPARTSCGSPFPSARTRPTWRTGSSTLLHQPDVVDLRQDFHEMGESLAVLGQQVVESLDDDGRV